MNIDLHYGSGEVSLRIPEANIAQIIRPWHSDSQADNAALLQQAVSGSDAAGFQLLSAGKNVCVLVEDGTRDTPCADIFRHIFPLLRQSASAQFIICTGTHDADTPENKRIRRKIQDAARHASLTNIQTHIHDCQRDRFVDAGATSRGTKVLFSAQAQHADLFLVLSDVKAHYFAGYSNPIKNLVPGICAFETAEQNHSLALDDSSTFGRHPWHADPTRRTNPVAEDQLEGLRLIAEGRPVYTLAAITSSGQIQWIRLGPAEQVSTEAFDTIDQHNAYTVKPQPRLIVSAGGFPNDTNLYIAQRALELTKGAVADDGEILFLAACPNGIGDAKTMDHFYNLLIQPLDQVLRSIENQYRLYSHKPYKFAQLITRMRKIWLHSDLPDHIVWAAHLHPTHDPQDIVNGWLTEDAAVTLTVVDGANRLSLSRNS